MIKNFSACEEISTQRLTSNQQGGRYPFIKKETTSIYRLFLSVEDHDFTLNFINNYNFSSFIFPKISKYGGINKYGKERKQR